MGMLRLSKLVITTTAHFSSTDQQQKYFFLCYEEMILQLSILQFSSHRFEKKLSFQITISLLVLFNIVFGTLYGFGINQRLMSDLKYSKGVCPLDSPSPLL